MSPTTRRVGRIGVLAGSVAIAAGTLTACSGGSTQPVTTSPTVTSAGKHYSYSSAQVPRSRWPAACDLLTLQSAEAAIGTQTTTKRFHTSCIYQPASAAYPTVTVTLAAVGTDSGSVYQQARSRNASLHPTTVYGVGTHANQHRVPNLPATELEVDAGDAYFTVTSQSPFTERPSAVQTHDLLVIVGRAVAKEFSG